MAVNCLAIAPVGAALAQSDRAGGPRVEGLPVDHQDAQLVAHLLAGDEPAFDALVARYQSPLVRVAMAYVGRREVAEEVAQETWVAVLRGLARFQGRSSLKNWIFRILTNRAKTRGVREGRSVPFSTWRPDGDGDELTVDGQAFDATGRMLGAADWRTTTPERALMGAETEGLIREAIADLPDKQRIVITMRDVEGFSSQEVRELLDLSETYQRVLLHRARVKVRQALADSWEH